MKVKLVRIATRLLIAAAVAGSVAAAGAQSEQDLDTLTVPPGRLSPGCRLKATAPKTQVLVGAPGGVVVLSGESGPTSSNPWKGDDRRIAAAIRRLVDGSPPEPDGPPLDAEGTAAFALRWADNVVEAYGATYLSSDDSSINVYAVRFNDEKLATPAPPAGTRNLARGATNRVVLSPTVVLVVAGTRSSCFEAISEYVRSLR